MYGNMVCWLVLDMRWLGLYIRCTECSLNVAMEISWLHAAGSWLPHHSCWLVLFPMHETCFFFFCLLGQVRDESLDFARQVSFTCILHGLIVGGHLKLLTVLAVGSDREVSDVVSNCDSSRRSPFQDLELELEIDIKVVRSWVEMEIPLLTLSDRYRSGLPIVLSIELIMTRALVWSTLSNIDQTSVGVSEMETVEDSISPRRTPSHGTFDGGPEAAMAGESSNPNWFNSSWIEPQLWLKHSFESWGPPPLLKQEETCDCRNYLLPQTPFTCKGSLQNLSLSISAISGMTICVIESGMPHFLRVVYSNLNIVHDLHPLAWVGTAQWFTLQCRLLNRETIWMPRHGLRITLSATISIHIYKPLLSITKSYHSFVYPHAWVHIDFK